MVNALSLPQTATPFTTVVETVFDVNFKYQAPGLPGVPFSVVKVPEAAVVGFIVSQLSGVLYVPTVVQFSNPPLGI